MTGIVAQKGFGTLNARMGAANRIRTCFINNELACLSHHRPNRTAHTVLGNNISPQTIVTI